MPNGKGCTYFIAMTTFKDDTQVSETTAEVKDAGQIGGLILPDQALPSNLFVLPLNSAVVYPTMMAPLIVSIPKHVATIEEVINRQRLMALLLTKNGGVTAETKPDDMYSVGVAVRILKRLKMPDGSVNLLIHSLRRFKVNKVVADNPHIVIECNYLEDQLEKSTEMDAMNRMVISYVKKLSEVNPFFTEEMKLAMLNAPNPGVVADLVAFALSLPKADAQDFLETLSVKERFLKLLVHLKKEQDVADLQKKIQGDVNSKINAMQREFFLKEQLKAIRKELDKEEGDPAKAPHSFRERIETLGLSPDIKKAVMEEVEKFETISEHSPEQNVVRTYLETVCALPWNKSTKDSLDLKRARKILDEDHYGIEKVKDRIIEFLAVRKLKTPQESEKPDEQKQDATLYERPKNAKGSIICLIGPPGAGKTSVGRSIARTMGRKFYRFSLGGMRDEAEIKGHRRTYIGAMPGKIIQALKRTGSKNSVIMLDEIDKLGLSFQGDPASALLEVLDAEQNHAFLDHYLDVPFDLSDVLFIATANNTATIPPPLLDRMEIIELPGYTVEEKEQIAIRHVIPKVFEENGIKTSQLRIPRTTLRQILVDYAREPGLRTLQQMVDRIARKAAAKIVSYSGKSAPRVISVSKEKLRDWLGPKRFYNELAERINAPGIVTGLAWTPLGGEVLFIEATDIPGTGNLKLTGQMGEVMVESAGIAWSYVKKKFAAERNLESSYFRKKDIHVHIPAGAIPKDGPSAGVTMATALYSLLTGKLARQKTSMTGELSLTGKVLPVGGIKEKLLAARRAGITKVILPKLNENDLLDIPDYALKGLKISFASRVEDVFSLALCGPEAKPVRSKTESCVLPKAVAGKIKEKPLH